MGRGGKKIQERGQLNCELKLAEGITRDLTDFQLEKKGKHDEAIKIERAEERLFQQGDSCAPEKIEKKVRDVL